MDNKFGIDFIEEFKIIIKVLGIVYFWRNLNIV